MKIYRRSLMTGETNAMDLPVTLKQVKQWRGGGLIQDVFPDLTIEEREFIKTGITPTEWKQVDKYMGEVYD